MFIKRKDSVVKWKQEFKRGFKEKSHAKETHSIRIPICIEFYSVINCYHVESIQDGTAKLHHAFPSLHVLLLALIFVCALFYEYFSLYA